MTTCREIFKVEHWLGVLAGTLMHPDGVSGGEAYENTGSEGGGNGSGGSVEGYRGVLCGKVVPRQQQHCVGHHLPIQAIIATAHISRISRISLTPAGLHELVILSSAWEPTHA